MRCWGPQVRGRAAGRCLSRRRRRAGDRPRRRRKAPPCKLSRTRLRHTSAPHFLHAAGAAALAGLAACVYTVPWRSCWAAPPSAPKATRSFNVLWHGRALLALLLTAWAVSSLVAHAHGSGTLARSCNPPATAIRPAAFLSPPAFFPPSARSSPRCCGSAACGAPTRSSFLRASPAGQAQDGCAGAPRSLAAASSCLQFGAGGAAPDPWGQPPGGASSLIAPPALQLPVHLTPSAAAVTPQNLPHGGAGGAAAALCLPGAADADCRAQVRGLATQAVCPGLQL